MLPGIPPRSRCACCGSGVVESTSGGCNIPAFLPQLPSPKSCCLVVGVCGETIRRSSYQTTARERAAVPHSACSARGACSAAAPMVPARPAKRVRLSRESTAEYQRLHRQRGSLLLVAAVACPFATLLVALLFHASSDFLSLSPSILFLHRGCCKSSSLRRPEHQPELSERRQALAPASSSLSTRVRGSDASLPPRPSISLRLLDLPLLRLST